MRRTTPFPRTGLWLALILAACASACAVPLAPGYHVAEEKREVRFVPGAVPELQIHAQFKLVNSGNNDLAFIDVVLPEEKAYGRVELSVQVDRQEAAVNKPPDEYQQEQPNALRISFDTVWHQKQAHELTIDYAFRSPADSGSRITLGAEDFHLGSRGWFPSLQPPKHFLAPNPTRPDKTNYNVRVPMGFKVLARGIAAGQKKEGGETVFRFKLRAGDLAPYVVAGRYDVSGDERKSIATFWTLGPAKQDTAAAEAQIDDAWRTLQTDFGQLDKNIHIPHVVESAELRSHFEHMGGPAAAAFPGGVFVNPDALALGINSDDFFEMIAHALAHNWFGEEIYPAADASIGLGEGLPEYGAILIDESRGGADARTKRILRYLYAYDAGLRAGTETTLTSTTMDDPVPQRRIALAKAPLFMAALEDECGARAMRTGVAEMLTLLRGQEVSYADLRSALEHASGKNLADLFRVWLNEKGIPADFRARYEGKKMEKEQ